MFAIEVGGWDCCALTLGVWVNLVQKADGAGGFYRVPSSH